ncbi:hypothetical protein H072_10018 [Dactylellina haptotyla CBS 200.50]|uniref:Uncharacterized protein n=1 Tax=Dactylellina haptotyla (strain CBS 200.50) TaxID=1284197 RepID=S8BBC0_DACHA|nr:hypothetical protein H072_10018 [Dactylellina haptotyla CBS 200.50]
MKFTRALLAATAAGTALAAVAPTLVTETVRVSTVPTVSPSSAVPSSSATSSPKPSSSATPTTTDTIVPPSEPSYPPATGTPGATDKQVDAVISELKSNIVAINAKYNATCANSCNASHIQAWGDEHAKAADLAVAKFKVLPPGYLYWWYPSLVWNLGWIWIEIYYSLWFIWGRAGLIWEIIYFNRYLWNFYVSWRALFWYFGRFGGYCFWPYWYGWFYRYYWGWGWVWWSWWRIFWWW